MMHSRLKSKEPMQSATYHCCTWRSSEFVKVKLTGEMGSTCSMAITIVRTSADVTAMFVHAFLEDSLIVFGSQCSKMSKLILVLIFLPTRNIATERTRTETEAIQCHSYSASSGYQAIRRKKIAAPIMKHSLNPNSKQVTISSHS